MAQKCLAGAVLEAVFLPFRQKFGANLRFDVFLLFANCGKFAAVSAGNYFMRVIFEGLSRPQPCVRFIVFLKSIINVGTNVPRGTLLYFAGRALQNVPHGTLLCLYGLRCRDRDAFLTPLPQGSVCFIVRRLPYMSCAKKAAMFCMVA